MYVSKIRCDGESLNFFLSDWTGTSVVRMHDRWRREGQGRPGDSDEASLLLLRRPVPLKPGRVSVPCLAEMAWVRATQPRRLRAARRRSPWHPQPAATTSRSRAWSLEWNGSSRPQSQCKSHTGGIGERAPLPAGGRGGGDPFRFLRGPGRIRRLCGWNWNWNWVRVTDGRSWPIGRPQVDDMFLDGRRRPCKTARHEDLAAERRGGGSPAPAVRRWYTYWQMGRRPCMHRGSWLSLPPCAVLRPAACTWARTASSRD